jgi:hypothetical protein
MFKNLIIENLLKIGIFGIAAVSIFYLIPANTAEAAILSLSPPTGTFVIGGTFDVSVFLNTQGESVNAISVFLRFPADKLQGS